MLCILHFQNLLIKCNINKDKTDRIREFLYAAQKWEINYHCIKHTEVGALRLLIIDNIG